MKIRYRSYDHADNEASAQMKRTARIGERGVRFIETEQWTIQGMLIGSTQAAISTEIEELIDAYSQDGGDLTLFLNSGSESPHVLRSRDTIGGLRVVQLPSFPVGDGSEYAPTGVSGRTYEIIVEADFAASNDNLISWSQSFSTRGVAGAERWAFGPTINGYWPRDIVNERMPITIVQRGSAVGRDRYPVPSPPLFPADEHKELREIIRDDPERRNRDLTNFKIAWSYTFEALTARSGQAVVP